MLPLRSQPRLGAGRPGPDPGIEEPGTFTIVRQDGDIPFHGILAEFEQLHAFKHYVFYRAVLVPRLWWLQLTFHNQVFLNMALRIS